MAIKSKLRDFTPILECARTWIDRCLIEDHSMFLKIGDLWTAPIIAEVSKAFIDNPDQGKDDFITKLKRQLTDVSNEGKQLTAEMLWILLLFPSNIGVTTKQQHIRAIWELSGSPFPSDSACLQPDVVRGIGSGGPGFNNHRWRELAYLMRLAGHAKLKTRDERSAIFSNYDTFVDWIESLPRDGWRQFRHMLRYFAFPSRVERMSSNGDRREILAGFGVAPVSKTNKWSDRELDDALVTLRRQCEAEHPGEVLDFYAEPLQSRWKQPKSGAEKEDTPKPIPPPVDAPGQSSAQARNLILFGPPGTGKTFWLQQRMKEYSDGADGRRRYRLITFHPSVGYEDFIRGIRPVADAKTGIAQFKMVDGVFKQICDEARADPSRRYAIFIDEINRANIAKVFGELITLAEHDKRAAFDASGRLVRGMAVQLPGSQPEEGLFGVPENLDIYGTMNTADRSIALLDIALRRRFEFEEMEPEYDLLQTPVDDVDLGSLLERINDRLEYFLDRDHRIGHAYLIKVRTIEELARAFETQIIPLIQEYFFDDLARVADVLRTSRNAPPFVQRRLLSHRHLFPTAPPDTGKEERHSYAITPAHSWAPESYRGIYEDLLGPANPVSQS